MTFRLMACLTLALTVFASSVVAQDEGRGQRGGRGGQQGGGGPGGQGGRGFGGGFGMTRSAGGAGSILNILAMTEVRKEVGVTDEAYKPVGDMINEYREKQRGMRDATEDERKKATDEYNAKAQDVMDELLAPAKQKRLKGLYAQQAQARAVLNTVIAKEVGVSDTLRTEIEKGLQEQMEKMMASFQQGGGGGGAGMREAFTKAQEDASKFVESKLSAEQKKALEDLKGEKFEFPQPQFGFGGGQGGGNRGGQGGGQGGRPRGDGN